ncbi:ATP-binding protein [Pedobacter sp. MC2016-15]|uniref:AAA family ATPase n=1 Tax=Pedobacter sp. MC2016-15 TaxID=2994473 RepID=UPI002247C338|nr:ATP-binding protein [Pedobacter sp. MC2016-15]MCX2478319.1 ATP-binding protein [Pedobacter sp. MC2016-15]
MIVSISIRNFRSVKDKITLSFEAEKSKDLEEYYVFEPVPGERLLKLGLIYGANGSGKTTILKGLSLLRQVILKAPFQKQDPLDHFPFLFDTETPAQPTEFELIFYRNMVKYSYQIAFTREAITYEKLENYSPNKSLLYERKTNLEKQLSQIKFGAKAKLKKSQEETLGANTLWNSPVLAGFLRSNIDSTDLREVTDWFRDVLGNLISPKSDLSSSINKALELQEINKNHLTLFLQKADFKITDIALEKKKTDYDESFKEILKIINRNANSRLSESAPAQDDDYAEQLEIGFTHTVKVNDKMYNYHLPYDEESEGTQRYYQLSGILEQLLNKPGIALIDELESSLHPDLLKHFLLLFLVNVKDSQLIATTHYRELLLERNILRDDAIWFTEKKQDGSMELYSLSDFDSSVVRDTTSVFNAYRSGKLGAVPQVSDHYLDIEDGKK